MSPVHAVELRRDAPVEITADRIICEAPREVYVAEGSVRVVQQGRSIEADWAVFNRYTLRGIAAGDVVVVDGEQTLEANFVEYVSPCKDWAIHVDVDNNRNRGCQANATFRVMGFGGNAGSPFAGKSRFGSDLIE